MRVLMLWVLLCACARAEDARYQLRYSLEAPTRVRVRISWPRPVATPATLIMPRNYPGGYAQLPYDSFVADLAARSTTGAPLEIVRDDDGPRWRIGAPGERLAEVDYEVDVGTMEQALHDAVAASRTRAGYAGLLGYSVFAYLEGADGALELTVEGPAHWPLLSTLDPRLPLPVGTLQVHASDYYALADSQILMGPDLTVERLEGTIPLILATYAEAPVDRALEGRLARDALDRVQAYFGDRPIAHYTVQLELLKPLAGHAYGFSQEHLDSGSFGLSVEAVLTEASPTALQERTRFNFAHHMAHSWIPKRAYGRGYRPFNWEMTPVIDTIWFNEGFGRYAAIEALAEGLPESEGRAFRDVQLASLRRTVETAPVFLRRMPLSELSREASFLYAADFRTGRNVFARGALMAAEMDDRIRARSRGARSLRDGLRALLRWSGEHHRAFDTEELPRLLASATGVDVADILERWQQPLERP